MKKDTRKLGPIELFQLRAGDIIRVMDGPFCDAVVKKVHKDGSVTVFRPYGTCTDFEYSDGVICYTGIEEFKLYSKPVVLLQRTDVDAEEG